AYQRSVVRVFEALVLLFLGELGLLREVFDAELQGQLERGNLRGAVVLPLLSRAHQLELAADRPAAARQMIRDAINRWGQTEFGLLQLYAWWARIDVLLYEGRAAEAWAECHEPSALATHRPDLAVLLANWALARGAVARAAELDPGQAAPFLREAARRARRMERLRGIPIASPHGWLIRAAIAHPKGRDREAVRYLERAEAVFAAARMVLHAGTACVWRGRLVGNKEGEELAATAVTEMVGRGVCNPARFTAMLAPGFNAG